ncbi:MAG: hypothetical protein IJP92_08285 [Lachnospiraceae bacterium]|nr:hypothetical protein [Lachnospiraceae bacterium]
MKKRFFCSTVLTVLLAGVLFLSRPFAVCAAPPLTIETFDEKRYADTYADLKAAFGYDKNQLWNHYQTFGIKEGREAYAINAGTSVQGSKAAATTALTAETFDYTRYAEMYPDLKKAFGYDKNLLWNHYLNFGKQEGRQVFVIGASGAPAVPQNVASSLVPLSELKQMRTFSRYLNDTEFEMVYAVAKPVVEQWVGLSRREQVQAVATYVSNVPYTYSMRVYHFTDPYGLLINGYASCAGHTKTVGFLLAMLGIPYEHINEGKYQHQWARVQVDGIWYCVDGMIGMMMAEPAPKAHPAFVGNLFRAADGTFYMR